MQEKKSLKIFENQPLFWPKITKKLFVLQLIGFNNFDNICVENRSTETFTVKTCKVVRNGIGDPELKL